MDNQLNELEVSASGKLNELDDKTGGTQVIEAEPKRLEDTINNSVKNTASSIKVSKKSSITKKAAKKNTIFTSILRFILSLFTLIFVIFAGILGAVTIVNYGPSTHARDLFVVSVMETSGIQFLAKWYFSDEEIKQIQLNNSVKPLDEVTDTDLVTVGGDNVNSDFDINKVEVVDISSSKYKGKMMIVNDPKKIMIGTIAEFGENFVGRTVTEMVSDNNCIGGTNAGGFADLNGVGNGGTPLGIVISKGELKWGSRSATYELVGFDKDGKMHVGNMTGQQALDKGIQEAVSFGPTLIVNGKPSEISGTAGGWNPRTAIGQRADGSVLIMVIDGRQTTSIGATYGDLINEMLSYGAVNAYNLDGGTSSHMVYNGNIITSCSSLYGTRKMPTAILVKGE